MEDSKLLTLTSCVSIVTVSCDVLAAILIAVIKTYLNKPICVADVGSGDI